MRILWTDGSASPNPGPGGYAVIENGEPVRLGRSDRTTNIRMEAAALLAAMKYAREQKELCEIHTDSQLWVNVMTKWMAGWKAKGWKKSDKKPIQNLDLVQMMDKIYNPQYVKLVWVRGHVGTEENELADIWANRARLREDIPAGLKVNEVPALVTDKDAEATEQKKTKMIKEKKKKSGNTKEKK